MMRTVRSSSRFSWGGGVCLSACWDNPPGTRPPGGRHPLGQGTHLPGADTPQTRHPPGADTPLVDRQTPVKT